MQELKKFFSTEDLFARHAGIELVDVGSGWAKASMKIEPFHFNGAKTVHGGAIFTLADFAFAVASNSHGTLAMGIKWLGGHQIPREARRAALHLMNLPD